VLGLQTSVGSQALQHDGSATHKPTVGLQTSHDFDAQPPEPPFNTVDQRQLPFAVQALCPRPPQPSLALQLPPGMPHVGSATHKPHEPLDVLLSQIRPAGQVPPQVTSHKHWPHCGNPVLL
jgi:hypothetical protein